MTFYLRDSVPPHPPLVARGPLPLLLPLGAFYSREGERRLGLSPQLGLGVGTVSRLVPRGQFLGRFVFMTLASHFNGAVVDRRGCPWQPLGRGGEGRGGEGRYFEGRQLPYPLVETIHCLVSACVCRYMYIYMYGHACSSLKER